MSCFLLPQAHIDALVCARYLPEIVQLRIGDEKVYQGDPDDRLGARLWLANVYSVRARYPEEEKREHLGVTATPEEFVKNYRFRSLIPTQHRNPVEYLKAFHCYLCQCDDWEHFEQSDAHAYVTAMIATLTGILPGYVAAPWVIS